MRGKSSGVESKLQDKAPHLLEIDSDVCHICIILPSRSANHSISM